MAKATARPASKLAAARASKKAATDKAKVKKVEVTEVPEWQGDEVFEMEVPSIATEEHETKTGKVIERPVRLSRTDFPKTRDGRLAFADYQIATWVARRQEWEKRSDPNAKKVRQVERLRAQLEKLEAELKKNKANGDSDEDASEE